MLKHAIVLAALISLGAPVPGLAATHKAVAANVDAVVKRAVAGDTIVFDGEFPRILVIGRTWSPSVRFDLTGARVGYLQLNKVEGVDIIGGTYHATDWHGGVYVANGSARVTVRDVTIRGERVNVPGVTFRDTTDVSLSGSKIADLGVGVGVRNTDRFVVRGNVFTGLVADGVDVLASSSGLIEKNTCRDFAVLPDLHPDCVQILDPKRAPGSPPSADIRILDNLAVGGMQGFGAFQGADRLEVRGNVAMTSWPQAFGIFDCKDCVIADNQARTLPGSDFQSGVNIVRPQGRTIVCGNETEAYRRWPKRKDKRC